MNFQQLEYALALHEIKHFARAADQCNVTQATLSAMLKRLEEEIGYPLFDRSSHPIQATEEGVHFMQLAVEILSKKEEILSLKEDEQKDLVGELRLGIIPTVSNTLLPLFLADFTKENPNLKLKVKELTTEEIIKQLKSKQLDLGILSTPLPEDYHNLEEVILYYESMMVYGVDDNKKEYISSADVKGGQIWLLEEGHCFRNQSLTICDIQEKKLKEQQLEFKANSFETLINLSDQFGGFTLIPELYFKNLSPQRKKRTKGFNAPIPVREISLVANQPLQKKNAMRKLSKLIQSTVPPLLESSKHPNKDLDIIHF